MAKLLRGLMGGQNVKIHQFCNDWFDVILPNGKSKIVSPLSIELDPEETILVYDSDNTGIMFDLFDLELETGRFFRKEKKHMF